MVPEAALEALANENIPFTVKGKAIFEHDVRTVLSEWLAEAVLEVVDHFGAATYETQMQGRLRSGDLLDRDVRLVVDVRDLIKTRR